MRRFHVVVVAPVLASLITLHGIGAVPSSPTPQSTAPARPDRGSSPPDGTFRAGQTGVRMPRVVREVKPQYTPDAMRAKIEGRVIVECVVQPDGTVGEVRVVRSLDAVFGLDDEAVKAAKQWRFLPGMKDDLAVPVRVTIELFFTLRAGAPPPAPLAWPQLFARAGEGVAGSDDWTEDMLQASGLQVRFAYPKPWTLRKDISTTLWFGVQSEDGTRLLVVSRPYPVPSAISQPLAMNDLQKIADTIKGGLSARGSSATFHAVGQIEAAGRLWLWYDLWVPANDPHITPDVAARLPGVFDGTRTWTFMTTAGPHGIEVECFVVHPRGTPEAVVQEEVQAGPQFAAMLARISISVR
jgi:TonB family protein